MRGPDPDFATFCRAEHRRLVGALALVVGDAHVAEELAQEAFLRADRQWRQVRDFDAPATWLLTVAMNLARSHLRRRLAARRAAVRMGPLDTAVEPPAVADHVAVRDAVAELPRRDREVVVLRYFCDLDVASTAAVLGLSETNVGTITHRAIQQLRASSGLLPETPKEASDV